MDKNLWEGSSWEDPDTTRLLYRDEPAQPNPPNVRPVSAFPMDENAIRRTIRSEIKGRPVYSEQIGFWSSYFILIKGLIVLAIILAIVLGLKELYDLLILSAM